MTQDTRKDRRVKIVSLNVRYKSATVDEFIENHAHDVSRGGIYIKTANPFPAGTLLKFEIRLASDQAVITGVGRVVWKRDTTQGTGERPAGMGVKFIKVDEPSKTVIDKLVNTKSDAGRAFESEPDATVTGTQAKPGTQPPPAPRPAPGARLTTPSTMPSRKGSGSGSPSSRPPAAVASAASPTPSAAPAPVETATASTATPSTPPRTPSVVPRPRAVPAMFPRKKNSDPPGEGQTVMKQAAELLEEALREAGGSMEEVGTNPLFSGAASPPSPTPAAGSGSPAGEGSSIPIRLKALPPDEALTARVMVANLSPGPVTPAKAATTRAAAVSGTPVPVAESVSVSAPASARSSRTGAVDPLPPPKKSGGTGTWLAVGALVVAGGVGVSVYRSRIFGNTAEGEAPMATASAMTQPVAVSPAAGDDGRGARGHSLGRVARGRRCRAELERGRRVGPHRRWPHL